LARLKESQCTKADWLARTDDAWLRAQISQSTELEHYNQIVSAAQAYRTIDWQTAVALLHMVYAWMPTMLLIGDQPPLRRKAVPGYLEKAKRGLLLSKDELDDLKEFTNNSTIGSSKLLHVLNPAAYPIWDSRVARVFMWWNVSESTFNQSHRYLEYREKIGGWTACPSVKAKCADLRGLHAELKTSCDLRMVELGLFFPTKKEAQLLAEEAAQKS
jgi:hypothetical protein